MQIKAWRVRAEENTTIVDVEFDLKNATELAGFFQQIVKEQRETVVLSLSLNSNRQEVKPEVN
jgi:hypothetical protein